MQIQGNALFSALSGLQRPSPAGPRQTAQNTQAQPAEPGRGPGEVQAKRAARTGQAQSPAASGLAKAQNLEQAVQTLSDQGRLPPRGSLVDLRA